MRFHQTTQNGAYFKSTDSFISKVFHLIFLDPGTVGNWNCEKQNWTVGDYCIFLPHFLKTIKSLLVSISITTTYNHLNKKNVSQQKPYEQGILGGGQIYIDFL